MCPHFILNGDAIVDIDSFYAQINQIFMRDESWQLGSSLDALDDLLYASHGALTGVEDFTLHWRASARSAQMLGMAATTDWLQAKLEQPQTFNTAHIKTQLQALQRDGGPTYYERILQVFATHPRVRLLLE